MAGPVFSKRWIIAVFAQQTQWNTMSYKQNYATRFLFACLAVSWVSTAQGETNDSSAPLFDGTAYILPDLLTADDPSVFIELTAHGIVQRDVFDDDVQDDVLQDFYHYTASFSDAETAAFLSSIRFDGEDGARQAAERIAFLLGQMPRFCREGPLEIQLYAEFARWGANKDEMFLELEDIDEEAAAGTLEETMLHECGHSAVDPMFSDDPEWLQAQRDDGTFISTYAAANDDTEDLAETLLVYYALELHPDRVSDDMRTSIENAIPNRLAFLRAALPPAELAR